MLDHQKFCTKNIIKIIKECFYRSKITSTIFHRKKFFALNNFEQKKISLKRFDRKKNHQGKNVIIKINVYTPLRTNLYAQINHFFLPLLNAIEINMKL